MVSELFLCNVEDSIKSEQNLTSIASGRSKSLRVIVGDNVCVERVAVDNVHHVNKLKVNELRTNVQKSGRRGMSPSNNNSSYNNDKNAVIALLFSNQ